MRNLLGDPAPTRLPVELDTTARELISSGSTPAEAAAAHPAASYPWALLAQIALAQNEHDDASATSSDIAAYAYARTGYHRGLDALRRAGWKGHGPVPADHVPNQGFLICLLSLAEAAARIGETDEATRCGTFATDCDPAAPELVA